MYTKSLRWLILTVVLLLVSSLACNGAAILDGEQQSSGNLSPATGNTIKVQARDFSFSLDATTARAGEITFVVENNGGMVHDFAIETPEGESATPHLSPGESATITVDLQSGTYAFRCTVPGHEQMGMRGTLTVVDGES